MKRQIVTDDGKARMVAQPTGKAAEERARWLRQVTSDGGVTEDGRFVASIVAFSVDEASGSARMSSRDIIATCGAGDGALSTEVVRAGITILRERGHLVADRDGRWQFRIHRLLVEA